jgi:prepilin-type N-terminal cleavage/methylation domain-containing protein
MGKKRGFTLVEVLVVMAIVAVLLGLLLPFLSRAHEQALTTQCLSNLRQDALAWTQYARDHNDQMFYTPPAMANTSDTANSIEHLGLFQYCPQVSFWRCPADTTTGVPSTHDPQSTFPQCRSHPCPIIPMAEDPPYHDDRTIQREPGGNDA